MSTDPVEDTRVAIATLTDLATRMSGLYGALYFERDELRREIARLRRAMEGAIAQADGRWVLREALASIPAEPEQAEHSEGIWGPGAFHPGYGKGVCAVDGEPWPCRIARLAAARAAAAEPEQADCTAAVYEPGPPGWWQRCTGPAFHDGGHIYGWPEPEQADEVARLASVLHALHSATSHVACGWGWSDPGEPSDCAHFAAAILARLAPRDTNGEARNG